MKHLQVALSHIATGARTFRVIVFVMEAPPLIPRGLRPSLRRVLPVFLPAERCHVKPVVRAEKNVGPAVRCVVSVKDVVVIPKEDTHTTLLATFVGGPKVVVEIAAVRGISGDRPTHAPFIRLNLRQWSTGHQYQGGVSGMHMG